nr:immunoglobulin heavy chain junction region [Macaca mulatta]MOW76180.1 immunoglobulin heavy chain junction region [Macaca mulatta]MOW76553.1 immunoglobulin heavy chain junction region [Macaca mulatta]MOW76919.1 immunoglobulin heavy chain junction region [Macaca mulatta]MOW77051.1 immunoglobulin heavy chain junction region [Macaca mulatta]
CAYGKRQLDLDYW